MPEMREYAARPTPVAQDLLLPDAFPGLPPSMRKRFGSDAAEFDDQLKSFWTRTRRVLADAHFGVAAPLNDVKEDGRNIRKEYVSAIGTMTASFTDRIDAIVSDTEAIVTRIQQLEASVISDGAEILARITTEEETRASQTAALATRTTTIEASITSPTGAGIMALLLTKEVALANATAAVATRTSTIEASITSPTGAGILARLVTEETTRATQTEALAGRTTVIESSLTNTTGAGVLARIITAENTAATATSAVATRTTAIESSLTNTTGAGVLARIITAENTAATATSAVATRTTNLETAINTATTGILARITNVENTKVDANGASAAASSVLTAQMLPGGTITNALNAAVTIERDARVTADGKMSGSLTLKATTGGVVTGINITSSVTGPTEYSSVIAFQSDKFMINTATGNKLIFVVDGSGNLTLAGGLFAASLNTTGTSLFKTQIDGDGARFGDQAGTNFIFSKPTVNNQYDALVVRSQGTTMRSFLGYNPVTNQGMLWFSDASENYIDGLTQLRSSRIQILSSGGFSAATQTKASGVDTPLYCAGAAWIAGSMTVRSEFGVEGSSTAMGQFVGQGKSAGSPTYSFFDMPASGGRMTGMYADEANKLKFACGGQEVARCVFSGSRFFIVQPGGIFRVGNARQAGGGSVTGYVTIQDSGGVERKLAIID